MRNELAPPTQTRTIATKRPANERGSAEHGWLHAKFTFSFGDYFNPDHMGFQALRVINNDTIEPGGGFPLHPHRDMEIFTYVISGRLQHRDSLGNGSIISAGNLQYMSAGSGIQHSEYNPSTTTPTHLYQIWLKPKQRGGNPRYAEKPLKDKKERNTLQLLFSPDGRDRSTAIRQNASIYFAEIDAGKTVTIPTSKTQAHAWIQLIDGELDVMDTQLEKADGLQLEQAPQEIALSAKRPTTILVFRLADLSLEGN